MENHPAVKASTSDVVVLDDFLEPELHETLLAHALAQSDMTEPTKVYGGGARTVDPTSRVADLCIHGLGTLADPFVERIMARFEAIVGALGIRPFPVAEAQLELVAHNEGAMFSRHIDTLTEENRPFGASASTIAVADHRRPVAGFRCPSTQGACGNAPHPNVGLGPRTVSPSATRCASTSLHRSRRRTQRSRGPCASRPAGP